MSQDKKTTRPARVSDMRARGATADPLVVKALTVRPRS
jgi:hypothetical protein